MCSNYHIDSFKEWLNIKFLYHTLWKIDPIELNKNKRLQRDLSDKVAQMFELAYEVFMPSFVFKVFCARYSGEMIYLYTYDKCHHYCKPDPYAYGFIEPGIYNGIPLVETLINSNKDQLEKQGYIRDIIAFQIVTLGSATVKQAQEFKTKCEFQDYFYWHGFCAAMTEALAAKVHSMIRLFMGLENASEQSIENDFKQNYKGKRLSFGYESLPNIFEQLKVIGLLKAYDLDITMTESGMLEPEYSTCAMVLLRNI